MYRRFNLYVICLISFFIFSCEKPNKTELASTTKRTITPIKVTTVSNQEFNYDSALFSWQKQTAKGYSLANLSYKIKYGNSTPPATTLVEKIPFSDTSYNATEQLKNGGAFYWQLLVYHKNNIIDTSGINKLTVKPKDTIKFTSFSSDLENWNVSSVTNMRFMFYNAKKFNGKLNGWGQSVKNVTYMERMFSRVTSFNQEIGAWNVSSVTNMTHIFDGATLFNQGLNNWEVNNVTDMQAMFRKTSFNKPLNNWANRLGNVINIANMFQHNNNFLQDITTWDVGHVTNCAFFNNPSSLKDDKAPSNLKPTCKGNP